MQRELIRKDERIKEDWGRGPAIAFVSSPDRSMKPLREQVLSSQGDHETSNALEHPFVYQDGVIPYSLVPADVRWAMPTLLTHTLMSANQLFQR
jgi:hypothetical protein